MRGAGIYDLIIRATICHLESNPFPIDALSIEFLAIVLRASDSPLFAQDASAIPDQRK